MPSSIPFLGSDARSIRLAFGESPLQLKHPCNSSLDDFFRQMPYSDFSLRKVKDDFKLTLVERGRFLPPIAPIPPSHVLAELLAETIPLAIATGSEKARSELIISPVLVEVRAQPRRNRIGRDFRLF